jgi:hypothetical protein
MSSTTRKDATPTEPQMKLAIAQTLSQPFAYNAPVVMLDFSVNDQGEFEGKFKDATRPRIFSFNIKGQSVTFKPYTPGRMDSVDDWEEFSSGYSYRVDAGIGGNKKPQCVKPTAYNCGKACINIMKSCKIKTDDPTIKDRLKNLEGIGKNYAKTTKSTKSQKMSESVKIAKVDPIIEAEKPIEKPAEKQAQEKTKPLSNAQINAQTIEKLAKKAGVDISELEETAKKAGATEAQLLTLKNAVAKYQKTKGIVSGSQIKTTRSEEEGLTGDGSHKGMPRNAQEYYNLATKNGKQITLKEAQDTVEAIDDWTGDGYEEIRKDQKEGRVNERATLIDNYIKNLTPYKGEVYRGIIFDNKKEMEDWLKGDKDGVLGNQNAHASWSSELEVAKGFADIEEDDPDRVPVVIKSVNNKSGVSIANLSRFGEPESEVIVSKDAKHKVKSVREEGGVVYVEVEEVDPMTEKESSKSKDKSVISKPKAENQNPIPAAEKTVEPKTKPEAEKQPVKNLAGDGTHDGAPKNAQEYYDAVTKTGKQITLKEAQDTANAIKYWTGKGSSEIREDQKNGRENKQADQIDEFIKNSTPYKGEIYRGITFSSEDEAMKWAKGDKDGIVGNQSAHSSWTSDIAIAAHFTELDFSGEKSTQVIIKSTNKSGASIRNLSVFGKPEAGKLGRDEKEVVVSKNTRHKFKGVTKKDGILYVEVEEVDTPIEKPAKQEEVKSQEEVKAQQQPPVRKVGKLTPSVASIEEMLKTTEEWLDKSEEYLTVAKKVLKASPPGEIIKYGNNQEIERKVLEKKIGLVGDSRTVTFGLGVTAESIELGETEPGVQDTFFLKDESGKTQGFFLTGNDKSKESMYIEFLGTNPSNIITNTKGVGKQIIYHAIQESMKRGFRGKIKLEALSSAEPFYESVGFTTKIGVDGYTEDFDLSEESAKAFVKEYEKKLKQDKI